MYEEAEPYCLDKLTQLLSVTIFEQCYKHLQLASSNYEIKGQIYKLMAANTSGCTLSCIVLMCIFPLKITDHIHIFHVLEVLRCRVIFIVSYNHQRTMAFKSTISTI